MKIFHTHAAEDSDQEVEEKDKKDEESMNSSIYLFSNRFTFTK